MPDTLPLSQLLEGEDLAVLMAGILRSFRFRYGIVTAESVIVEALYFAEREGRSLARLAEKLLATVDSIAALRDEPLRHQRLLERLGYTDTELLLASRRMHALLLTRDEELARIAQGEGLNSYVLDWLASLEPAEIAKLLCPGHSP